MATTATVMRALTAVPAGKAAVLLDVLEAAAAWNESRGRDLGMVLEVVPWLADGTGPPSCGDLAVVVLPSPDDAGAPGVRDALLDVLERRAAAGRPVLAWGSEGGRAAGRRLHEVRWFRGLTAACGLVGSADDVSGFRQALPAHLALVMEELAAAGDRPAAAEAAPGPRWPISEAAALLLLRAAAFGGRLMVARGRAGWLIRAGSYVADTSTRERVALWRGAVDELRRFGLVDPVPDDREAFRLTPQGLALAAAWEAHIDSTTEPD